MAWRLEADRKAVTARWELDEVAVREYGLAPGISVVVPSHNGRAHLGHCLRSLAAQTLDRELFEVIVVLNGDSDGSELVVDELRGQYPDLTLRTVRLRAAGASRARNAGIATASREYTTFVDDDDYVSSLYLEVLLRHAGPRRIPIAAVVDVGPNGDDPDNHINRMLSENAGKLIAPADVRVATTFNAAKAVSTSLIKDILYDEALTSGEDVLFWMTVVVRHSVTFYACPVSEGAIYHRVTRQGSVSRSEPTFDFAVRQRLDVISRLECLDALADGRTADLLHGRIRAQSAFINDYLTQRPTEHHRVVDLLDRRPIFHLPYDRMNRRLARGLVVAYAFPPYSDTSAVVMAKRVRARGEVVDVITNAMGRIREVDPSLQRISGPFVAYHEALRTPTYFSDWGSMERFALEGLEVAHRWEAGRGPYPWVYSRAHFAASHFLAAAYKLSRPGVRWIAEFSDPISRDVHDEERGTPIRRGPFLRSVQRGMRTRGLPLPRSRNCFVWCEELAYALADELIFTNEDQMEHMLGYCSNRSVADAARRKARIDPHPTLPTHFYSMIQHEYALDDGRVHLAYFGNFYATRGLDDVLRAIARADVGTRDRLRLHVFTSRPAELELRASALGVSECVRVGPYVRFLEFLNLSTKFDCLIVNDAATDLSHGRNPYLPSKWSDYRGSGSPIWGLVERGSPLSRQPLDHRSAVGDVDAAARALKLIVDKGSRVTGREGGGDSAVNPALRGS
jgi:glycosyltransferase involved in cell wall biosynthesis